MREAEVRRIVELCEGGLNATISDVNDTSPLPNRHHILSPIG